MPRVGNLHTSLCRCFAVPTSPTLPYASLCRCRHSRIEQIPLVAYRTSFTMPPSSKLVVSGELERFPLHTPDFSEIRLRPGLAYFDKTEYIAELEKGIDSHVVCRPKRFGKSLTLTMLRYFHGFQFRHRYNELFKVCGCGMLSGQDLHAHITYAKLGSRRGRSCQKWHSQAWAVSCLGI